VPPCFPYSEDPGYDEWPIARRDADAVPARYSGATKHLASTARALSTDKKIEWQIFAASYAACRTFWNLRNAAASIVTRVGVAAGAGAAGSQAASLMAGG
jgi:hypothetical protein